MTRQKRQQISLEIPDEVITKWQRIVNLMAKTLNVPAGLIMRVDPPQIEVFISSQTEKNPYKQGERADLKTGLYCETVMNKKKMLHVPDALKDPLWDHNPDIKLDMTSYLGFPIQWPDGKIFGTICVLDSDDNTKIIAYKEQMEEFRNAIESDLRLLDNATKIENLNQELKEQQIILEKKVSERTNDLKNKNNELIDEISRRKKSEEKFSSAFNNSPNALILSEFETGKIYDVNKAFTSLTGHSRKNATGNTTIGLNIWKADVSRDDLVAKMKKGSPIRDFEITFLKKSGEEFISLLTVNQLDIDDRNMILSSIIDITAKRKAEIFLQESERKYRTLYNKTPAMVHSINEQGYLLSVSDYWLEHMGYKHSEVIGHKSTKFLTEDSKRYAAEVVLPEFFKKGFVRDVPYQFIKKNGEIIDVLLSAIIEYDEAGKVVRSLAVIIDITEQKNTENALRESEDKFSIAFHSGPDIITISRMKDGKYIDVNEAFCRLSGYKKEEVIGNTSLELNIFKNKKDRQKLTELLGKKGRINNLEIEYRNIKGETIYGLTSIEMIDFKNSSHMLTIVKDITERKKAREALRESETQNKALLNTTLDMAMLIEKNGKILSLNNAMAAAFNQPKNKMIHKNVYNLLPPNLAKQRREQAENAAKSGSVVNFIDKRAGRWLENSVYPIFNEKRELSQYAIFSHDITIIKQSEKEIKELKDKLQAENIYLRKTIEPSSLHQDIVGNSFQIKDLIAKALQVAPMESNVLLLGETGTGKELITKGIHEASKRKAETLVTVNCAAIPDSLIESELFGHEKGAFTDAQSKKIGLFEIADKSTIFLDEIGEMPYNTQSKLLRVLENREVLRIGSSQPIKIDVRIIAATNQDLPSLIKEKKFRQDLYYRLNVFPIELPPLRTRKQDIKPLVEKFVEEFNNQMGRKVTTIPKKMMETLEKYSWPGNVRELKNIIERSMITSTGSTIKLELNHVTQPKQEELTNLRDVERNHILSALNKTYWKIGGKGGAAEILGVNRSTLNSRIKKLGIKRS